jgi:hypothetical protein
MTFCDAHTYGCGCKTECEKTIDLGRFEKAAPVFTFTARDMLVIAALMSGFFAGSFWMAEQAFERVNVANQETAQW